MPPDESVTHWIGELKAGHETAANELWNRFYARLIGLARKKLRAAPKRAADEEDVVVSAFETFFRRTREGQFPRLDDRDDLWQLLVAITERKAFNQMRDQGRLKRGGGKVRGESVFRQQGRDDSPPGLDGKRGVEPTPEMAALLAEDLRVLLDRLTDDELRRIALLKLEGWTNPEIAAKTGRSLPTIERRLRLIRDTWGSHDRQRLA
jgi:RNA polymerase sigma factor (sigma-70 family)